MSSRLNIRIQASSLTLHCDIFHFDIISSLFPASHITTYDIHSLSFLSSLLTRHYPCFTFSGVSHVTTWRIVTFFPFVHPMGSGLKISIWEIVLLVRIHVTSICGEGSIIWVCIFMGGHSLLIKLCAKKQQKQKKNALFILSFSIEHMYGCASLLHWVYVLERVHMGTSFWDSILVYILGESMSCPFDSCERNEWHFFKISRSSSYSSLNMFLYDLSLCFDVG